MLSDSIGVKNNIPSRGVSVKGIDLKRIHEDKKTGFFWRAVAGFNPRGRLLSEQLQVQLPAKLLKNRRVFSLAETIRVLLLRPLMPGHRHNAHLFYQQRYGSLLLAGNPVVPVIVPRQTWLVAKSQQLHWQPKLSTLIGGKIIIAERHSVFCQLLFDYYAITHSVGDVYRGLPWSETHGACSGRSPPHECWQPDGRRDLFHTTHFFSATPEPCLVLFRKSRFGFWHIKLLAALLLLFILVAGLDALTGIQGYISLHTVSATGLLSGLIVGLAVIALVLLVMCMLRQ